MDALSGFASFNTDIALNQMKNPLKLGEAFEKADLTPTEDVLGSFGKVLKDQMKELNETQAVANAAVNTYATGGNIELHNVVLAVNKAEMSMELAVQIRNKLVSAYHEFSRMQV